ALPNLNNDIAKLLKETFDVGEKVNVTFTVNLNLIGTNIDGETLPTAIRNYNGEFLGIDVDIRLNPDILNNSSQEYILVTMYHEVVHAFLAYEKGRLGEVEFNNQYPNLKEVEILYGNREKIKKYQLIQIEGHNLFAPYIGNLSSSLLSFNSRLSLRDARALAIMGIVEAKSMSQSEVMINDNHRKGISGTKCR
ncbi:MAG: hypothetical protein Q4G08_07815, partial [Capnocytophaga sp.]|nr:hypothetical protein [Capnocytophaga sp.]